MTTKKERRENVARKTATEREAMRQANLKLLAESQSKNRLKVDEAEKAERSKKHAMAQRKKLKVDA